MEIVVWMAIAAVAVLALLFALRMRRTKRLRERFGDEYEREAEHTGRRRAESELAAREKRHDEFDIRPLDPAERQRFATSWSALQERFVDAPAETIKAADVLVQEVMRARRYPVEDFEQRAADLSVDHADVVEHYRAGHGLAESYREPGGTEELRRAMLHYRALFVALLETDEATDQVVDVRDEHPTRPIR